MSPTPFLDIDSIHKQFGKLEVLSDVNITVEEGGFLVLVGPSGCGKSTLLNLIAGFESASAGDIKLGGNSIMDLHPSRRDIAMVFQSYALYPNMNVADNIGFGMETRGVPKAERQQAINEVAEILQIGQLLKRKPAQLSGGQRQRVAMGRALVRSPRAFLFDEPLSNLDARLRVDMRAEIKKLHSRLGTTIVYVTHDQIEAMTLATKIAVLEQGKVRQQGTPTEIYNKPANLFVADFMGSPAMNRVHTPVAYNSGNDLCLSLAGQQVSVPEPSDELRARAQASSTVVFGIRAEDIEVSSKPDAADHGAGESRTINLTVDLVEHTGSDTFITTRDDDVSLTVRAGNQWQPVAGDKLSIRFSLDKAHFFDPDSGLRINCR